MNPDNTTTRDHIENILRELEGHGYKYEQDDILEAKNYNFYASNRTKISIIISFKDEETTDEVKKAAIKAKL